MRRQKQSKSREKRSIERTETEYMGRHKRRIKPGETESGGQRGNIQMHRVYGMAIHCGEGTNIQGFS